MSLRKGHGRGNSPRTKRERGKIETIAGATEEMLYKSRNSESLKTWGYENESIST